MARELRTSIDCACSCIMRYTSTRGVIFVCSVLKANTRAAVHAYGRGVGLSQVLAFTPPPPLFHGVLRLRDTENVGVVLFKIHYHVSVQKVAILC